MAALVVDADGLRARAGAAAVVAAGVALAFLAGGGRLGRPADAALAVAAVLTMVAAARWPDAAACAAAAVIVVVPVYWAKPFPVLPLAATPAAVAGVVLLPAAIAARDRLRLVALDGVVVLYFLLAAAAIVANVDGTAAGLGDLVARSVLPYVVFRLLASRAGGPKRLAAAIVAAAVPLAVLGIREADGEGNAFFTLVSPGFEAGQWLRSQVRFGQIRAEASFGHAIAFSLFLAIALLLVLGLAWRARPALRLGAVAVAAVLVAALFDTGSRGGVVSLLVGAAAWAVTLRGRRAGLLVVAGLVAAALVLTPAGDQLARLRDSVSDAGEAGDAARYRLEIARIITDPDSFSVLGQEAPPGLGAVNAAKELLGLRTIDSQYSLVYVTQGAVGLAAFVAVALVLVATTVRRRLDPVERAWAAATAATAVALTAVALFTQMLTVFWIAVAITAAVASNAADDG